MIWFGKNKITTQEWTAGQVGQNEHQLWSHSLIKFWRFCFLIEFRAFGSYSFFGELWILYIFIDPACPAVRLTSLSFSTQRFSLYDVYRNHKQNMILIPFILLETVEWPFWFVETLRSYSDVILKYVVSPNFLISRNLSFIVIIYNNEFYYYRF